MRARQRRAPSPASPSAAPTSWCDGNIGSRAGQVMKEGTLCCGGNAQLHGRLHDVRRPPRHLRRLGREGRAGHDRRHDLRRRQASTRSAPTPSRSTWRTARQEDVLAFLERYEIPFTGRFQKVVNAGKNLRYPRTEPRVRVIPFFVGLAAHGLLEREGAGGHRGQGADRPLPHPRLRRRPRRCRTSPTSPSSATWRRSTPTRDVVGKVDLRTSDRRPLRRQADRPLDARHDRADELRRALEVDQDRAGHRLARSPTSAENTGEGGLIPEVRAEAKRVVVQCLGGRLGWNIHDMRAGRRRRDLHLAGRQAGPRRPAHGQEGDAGDRAASAASRPGIDLRSPSRHPDVLGADDLVIKVEEFREATGYAEAGLGQARRRPRARRHQDRLQGRLRLRLARRHAGLDGRRQPRGAGVRRHPDAVRDHGGAGRARRDRRPPACRSC